MATDLRWVRTSAALETRQSSRLQGSDPDLQLGLRAAESGPGNLRLRSALCRANSREQRCVSWPEPRWATRKVLRWLRLGPSFAGFATRRLRRDMHGATMRQAVANLGFEIPGKRMAEGLRP